MASHKTVTKIMNKPLAERLRPQTIEEYIGQSHLVGPNGVFRKFLETGNVPSFILWGPPGVGKTTLLRIALGLLRPSQGDIENSFQKTCAVF